MTMSVNELIIKLTGELKPEHASAIALDFDGVCKLFTEHKHQIMSTLLFLHFPEFQKVPLEEYRKAYGYINFQSKNYAGKARFLCINALAEFLEKEKGYACKLSGLDNAIKTLADEGAKAGNVTLRRFSRDRDVKRALEWSAEVDAKVGQLTCIGLTPGIKKYILDAFREKIDFYLVSTATENSIRSSMEQEDIFFIRRYFGQETAGKSEALSALVNSGYKNVFMFGDSVEDSRASKAAMKETPEGVNLIFVPVIPDREEYSFMNGAEIINETISGNAGKAMEIATQLEKEFEGKEAGSKWAAL